MEQEMRKKKLSAEEKELIKKVNEAQREATRNLRAQKFYSVIEKKSGEFFWIKNSFNFIVTSNDKYMLKFTWVLVQLELITFLSEYSE